MRLQWDNKSPSKLHHLEIMIINVIFDISTSLDSMHIIYIYRL